MVSSFVELIYPRTKETRLLDALAIFGGSLFLALLSQVAIPLGFTPVPFTLQTFGLILLPALLGRKKATLSVLCYLFEGAVGLPVFALGASGIARLIGPSGGYLLAFPVATYLVGYLLERGYKDRFLKSLAALWLGSALVLLLGTLWLGLYVGFARAAALGLVPFLLGDFIKALLAAILIPSGWKFFSPSDGIDG